MLGVGFLLAAVLTSVIDAPADFELDIVPILTKAGCNAGACHGAAVGRGEFKLSLYGGDPNADHRAIALALKGRRVNLNQPELSLILLKATETVEHGGGCRLNPGFRRHGSDPVMDSERRASQNFP